jgi:hypothetical protein
MIEINGKKLDLENKSPKSEFYHIEKDLLEGWKFLQERHNLENEGRIDLYMFKEFKRKRQMSSLDGENFTTVENYPAGTQISLTSIINFKGTPYEIRYYKTKRPTNEPNVFKYEPTSLMITKDTSYDKYDRELLLFLYLFTDIVKNKPDKPHFIIETKNKAKFFFNDELVLARHKNERRNMVAKGTMMLLGLDDKKVKIFGSINGVKDSLHIDIIRDRIISMIDKQGKPMFEKLEEFISKYDDSYYGIQELVKAASVRKLIRAYYIKEKGNDFMEWYYVKNQSKDTLSMRHSGNEKKLSAVIDYMASNTDALNVLRDKYADITK